MHCYHCRTYDKIENVKTFSDTHHKMVIRGDISGLSPENRSFIQSLDFTFSDTYQTAGFMVNWLLVWYQTNTYIFPNPQQTRRSPNVFLGMQTLAAVSVQSMMWHGHGALNFRNFSFRQHVFLVLFVILIWVSFLLNICPVQVIVLL